MIDIRINDATSKEHRVQSLAYVININIEEYR